jgi:hypothetical protein
MLYAFSITEFWDQCGQMGNFDKVATLLRHIFYRIQSLSDRLKSDDLRIEEATTVPMNPRSRRIPEVSEVAFLAAELF